MNPDTINGTFETLGGFAILLSVIRLHQQKIVRGVSWPHTAFFTTWGLWNFWFYSGLSQWFSLCGGIFLSSVNAVWLCQILYYQRKERCAL
jgi:ABC-type arginine/histidine transport system permease subunit